MKYSVQESTKLLNVSQLFGFEERMALYLYYYKCDEFVR